MFVQIFTTLCADLTLYIASSSMVESLRKQLQVTVIYFVVAPKGLL
jgi:hypothetical protein